MAVLTTVYINVLGAPIWQNMFHLVVNKDSDLRSSCFMGKFS